MEAVVEKRRRGGGRGCSNRPVLVIVLLAVIAIAGLVAFGVYEINFAPGRERERALESIDIDLGELTLALRAYYDVQGEYPDELKSILGVTYHQDALPVDPYSEDGRTYCYFPMNDKKYVIVYSVGPDGKDNQGMRDIVRCVEPLDGDIYGMLVANLQMERAKDDPDNGIGAVMDTSLRAAEVLEQPAYEELGTSVLWAVAEHGWVDNASELAVIYPEYHDLLPANAIKQMEEWLEFNRPITQQIHEAVSGSTATFIQYEDEISSISPIPSLLMVQVEGILLCVEGARLEAEGRHEKALARYFDALGWGRAFGQALGLSGARTDESVERRAYQRIQQCLVDGEFSEEQLQRVVDRLSYFERTRPSLADALRLEQASIRNSMEDTWRYPDVSSSGEVLDEGELTEYEKYVDDNRELILNNAEKITGGLADVLEGRDPDFDLQKFIKGSDRVNQERESDLESLEYTKNMWTAQSRGTLILAALLLHEKRHGVLPENLEDLETILGNVPLDPYVDEPFVFERQNHGLSLRSRGPDGKDDGGVPGYDPTNGFVSSGDVVIGE